jgi:hypothetical protein
MAIPRNILIEVPNPLVPGFRSKRRVQNGFYGDHKSVYAYDSTFEVVSGNCRNPFTGTYTAYDAGNAPGTFVIPESKQQSTYNKAYGRFQGKARGAMAQIGATLGEYHQTSKMVKNRSLALYDSTLGIFRKWERLSKRYGKGKGKRFIPKKFADYWLEYSFGWSPFFGDLYNGMKSLCNETDPQRTRASAACFHEGTQGGGNPKHVFFYQYKVLVFGELTITNPNLALANNLGIVNPFSVAWELVPYSFVADWMFDIGGFINSWSDSFGFELRKCGVSQIQFGSTTQSWTVLTGQSKSTSVISKRVTSVSLPLPNLDVLRNIGGNLKRAANAIALTVQLVSTGIPPKRHPRKRR